MFSFTFVYEVCGWWCCRKTTLSGAIDQIYSGLIVLIIMREFEMHSMEVFFCSY